MTRAGKLITVDDSEMPQHISALLREVEEEGRLVRILRQGKVIAELRPPRGGNTDPLRQHPELTGVQFNTDPTQPLDDEDWPGELR